MPCAGMKRRIAQRFRPGNQRVRAIRQDTTASARGHESVRRLGQGRGACAHSVPGRNGGAWLRRCLRVRPSAQAMAPVTHAKSCKRGLHSQLSARLAAGERRDKGAGPGALACGIELSDADPVQGVGMGRLMPALAIGYAPDGADVRRGASRLCGRRAVSAWFLFGASAVLEYNFPPHATTGCVDAHAGMDHVCSSAYRRQTV